MKYKLIAIDIDGTLANGFNKISKKNLDALHKYYKKGGEIVICTGRSLLTTLDTVEKIETAIEGKIKYVICSKGAYIYDRINDKNYTYLIPDNTVRDLLFCCQRLKISFWAYTSESLRQNSTYVNSKFMRFLTVALPKFNLKKFPKDEDYSSYKLNIFSLSSKKIDYFLQYLEEKYHNQLDITHHNHLIEICTKNVNKGSAISKVCSLLDIQIENTAAIGDSNNDIDMFRNVKFKFAINHSEYLVEHADIVFKHQKNAVAKMIDDYILKNEK